MIGARDASLSPRNVNYGWATVDGVLGAEGNRAVSYDTENAPAEDLSRGNSLTGDLGIGVSAVCGLLDRFKVADC
jgi:hypothetical protein